MTEQLSMIFWTELLMMQQYFQMTSQYFKMMQQHFQMTSKATLRYQRWNQRLQKLPLWSCWSAVSTRLWLQFLLCLVPTFFFDPFIFVHQYGLFWPFFWHIHIFVHHMIWPFYYSDSSASDTGWRPIKQFNSATWFKQWRVGGVLGPLRPAVVEWAAYRPGKCGTVQDEKRRPWKTDVNDETKGQDGGPWREEIRWAQDCLGDAATHQAW